jgi:hypothetical protein
MGKRDYYKKGDFNVTCDRCGVKFKASECRMEWDNLFVCKAYCWERRQPQDFVRGRYDDQTVPISRPPGEARFINRTITGDDF